MSCRQFFPCRLANGTTPANYIGVAGDGYVWLTTAPASGGTICRWAGTWTNFIFQHVTAPGSGKSFTYTLVKNGVDTAVVITIADLATEGRSTAQVSASSGDTFYWRRNTSGTPTLSNVRYICEFAHATDNLNGHHGYDSLNATTGLSAPMFCPSTWTAGVVSSSAAPVSAPGTLTELYYTLTGTPGVGKQYQFVLVINGTTQDGTGGTTDTRVTISDAATVGSWSGSIALSAGDTCALAVTPTGTPTAVAVSVSVTFAPTTDGESNLIGNVKQNLPTTGTNYLYPAQTATSSMSTTETDVDVIGGVNSFILRDLRISLSSSVGTGPITFTTRQNGAGSGQAVTLTSGNATGSDTANDVTVNDTDTLTMEYVATGSPGAARIAAHAWVLYALAAPARKRVFIFGQGGTTTSTLTSLFNLDGVTRTVDLPQSHAIGGNLALIEQTSPPAGVAGTVRVWVEDNGSGKLRLMCQFPTGAAQQLAIEP